MSFIFRFTNYFILEGWQSQKKRIIHRPSSSSIFRRWAPLIGQIDYLLSQYLKFSVCCFSYIPGNKASCVIVSGKKKTVPKNNVNTQDSERLDVFRFFFEHIWDNTGMYFQHAITTSFQYNNRGKRHNRVHPGATQQGHFPSREGPNERRPISCAHSSWIKRSTLLCRKMTWVHPVVSFPLIIVSVGKKRAYCRSPRYDSSVGNLVSF